ncbi:L-serine ammonia-lyase [Pontivivens insulae]|uniref:L-serine dehydratase n=1 Tax=Pontivivens insulae TaxID=1639689 RepID=A0A2R8ADF3_9RHOB|nr:L-serine ammonia-lyase [Pontivivens insulae]RED14196.1 L-serine ammonia-lyase [Pontivivens insulae]SPF30271.1 L-serine dehydratase TdcG [Pontivivens insulae]
MFLSVFDIFKVGVGPSSSHTMGPMVAAGRFLEALRSGEDRVPGAGDLAAIRCSLHGSLAWTGKGHATDRAVHLGLLGFAPETFDAEAGDAALADLAANHILRPEGLPELRYDPATDLVFDFERNLPGHANAMILEAGDANGALWLRETYYSVGGGFVLTERELERQKESTEDALTNAPYPFHNAAEMLRMARESGKSIAQMKQANEYAEGHRESLSTGMKKIWSVMENCIDRGMSEEGILPGGLHLQRRARNIHRQLLEERGNNLSAPHTVNDWLSVYAMAVNEENAAGGQVVTAPTNGAAGVVPATIRYWLDHVPGASRDRIDEFLLTAAAIGGIIKTNASISGAEVGCQGEVGSAAAMAAAGLCAVMGGTPEQVENAAEIALEHHLGMTCDPIKGLVQAPCIERNGLGAIKAVSAASLSLRGNGRHLVSLDACVETMRQTGRDMSEKYKETSLGGLAVNVPEC